MELPECELVIEIQRDEQFITGPSFSGGHTRKLDGSCVVGKMNSSVANPYDPDPAAVFACAHSLWEACRKEATQNGTVDLSADYNGWDQLMREVMRIGTLFETWSCENIDFDNLDEVWPYHLGDNFGDACLSVVFVSHLARFDRLDCLRVALRLKLPLLVRIGLPVPVDLKAKNPTGGSVFAGFRIQTVRSLLDGSGVVPFTIADEPFDEEFGPPYFGFYGVDEDGLVEHIADRNTIEDAVRLAKNLVPGIDFPDLPSV